MPAATYVDEKELARRKHVNRQMDIIVMVANSAGGFLAGLFFSLHHTSFFTLLSQHAKARAGVFLLLPALLTVGYIIGTIQERSLWKWYLETGAPSPPSRRVQRLALELPIRNATISMAMWVLVGILVTLLYLYAAGDAMTALREMDPIPPLSMSGLAGPITALIVYFATERVWRKEVPFFFPHGLPNEVEAFRLTLRKRLFLPFSMGAIFMVVLAVVAYSQAAQLPNDPAPAMLLETLLVQELYLITVGIVVTVILAGTMGTTLVNDVETLRQGMETVQRGNLDVRLPVTSNDEFGELAGGFNAMVEGLQREEVIRTLFSMYVTPEVAAHALQHGAERGGELTEATVLFSDIRGFTALTERIPPDALLELLNRYFEVMSQVIVDHGGLLNKYGGDSLMAVFGSPVHPLKDHASRAVHTACAMMRALEEFNVELGKRGEVPLEVGVGIATGPLVAGNVGSAERLEYTVIGDAVNLASRLEGMTKKLLTPVLMSGRTAEAVRDWETLEPLGEVRVRGKREPVQIFGLSSCRRMEV
jgi:class 3 adenylate cyclase